MNKKRHTFFIIVLLLTFVFGFSFISFSYYTGVTNEVENINIKEVKNELIINGSDSNTISLQPNEIQNVTLMVNSLNPIKTSYKIFYECEDNIDVLVTNSLPDRIDAKEKQIIDIKLINNTDKETKVNFNIYSNYLGREIKGHGEEIKK